MARFVSIKPSCSAAGELRHRRRLGVLGDVPNTRSLSSLSTFAALIATVVRGDSLSGTLLSGDGSMISLPVASMLANSGVTDRLQAVNAGRLPLQPTRALGAWPQHGSPQLT